MKKCPYCAEEIQDDAIKCKHCGADLSKPSPQASQEERTLMELKPSWLLFPSIFPPAYAYQITTHRVVVREGLLSKNTCEVDIKDIRGIECQRSLFARIFGLGDLAISSAATAGTELIMLAVKDPEGVKNAILNQKRQLG